VVSGDSHDRRRIIHIGLVEFGIVVVQFAVVINHIAQVIKERGMHGYVRRAEVHLHVACNILNLARSVHSSSIPDRVKNQGSRSLYGTHGIGGEDAVQGEMERCRTRRGWKIAPGLQWVLGGIDDGLEGLR